MYQEEKSTLDVSQSFVKKQDEVSFDKPSDFKHSPRNRARFNLIDDDEHFDEVVTESNETDNEIMNNLVKFKPEYGLDSDVESDAGSTSQRFNLNAINGYTNQSDSETD